MRRAITKEGFMFELFLHEVIRTVKQIYVLLEPLADEASFEVERILLVVRNLGKFHIVHA